MLILSDLADGLWVHLQALVGEIVGAAWPSQTLVKLCKLVGGTQHPALCAASRMRSVISEIPDTLFLLCDISIHFLPFYAVRGS